MTQAMAARSENDVEWNDEQRKIIRDQFANGANDSEFAALMETARVRGLDPFKKQIYFVKRWDSQRRCEVWATQVSIDGLRGIAERTGRYDGQDEPEWIYDEKGQLRGCKVRVHRKDHSRPSVGVAFFAEYVQTTKEGKPTQFWLRMPHVMIAKCAEANAFRKGFPEETSGLYIPEEMGQAENGRVEVDARVLPDMPSSTSWEGMTPDVPAARPTPAPASGPREAPARTRLDDACEAQLVYIENAIDLVALDGAAAAVKALSLPAGEWKTKLGAAYVARRKVLSAAPAAPAAPPADAGDAYEGPSDGR